VFYHGYVFLYSRLWLTASYGLDTFKSLANTTIILGVKAAGRLPKMTQKTVLSRAWPRAKDKESTLTIQHEMVLYSFDDFLWRLRD
jgi:hypothetical protein